MSTDDRAPTSALPPPVSVHELGRSRNERDGLVGRVGPLGRAPRRGRLDGSAACAR